MIGISLSFSGDFSDPGHAAELGYKLWADQVNAHGGILGRKVQLKIVDDASSPNQVVTNYQTLITRDKVDLVFGPFSTLLTAPAARVASRYNYAFPEPSGGGPLVFQEKLGNVFFVQPAPVVNCGDPFVKYILSLPASQRPKTAAYPELDDPFSAPIAERARLQFEAAGIKTVFKEVYPPEMSDLTPVVEKMAAAKPDMVFAGTQSDDAYSMVNAMVQLGFSPKFLFQANGANSPVEFPSKVGAKNVNGIFSCGDWFPNSKAPGNQAVHQGLQRQVRRHAGEHRLRLGRGVRGRRGRRRGGEEDRQGRQRDHHQVASLRIVADRRGQPQLGQVRRAVGERDPDRVDRRQAPAGVPARPGAGGPGHPQAAVGRLGTHSSREVGCTSSFRRSSSACSPAASMP